ncbi:TetR/AcrR family transcriptional regulator [Eubacterium pyruvativorans]|uniref:TetR/AcrR family transcriptional regulator n=1 Tax=Eubacterium pyruvativorans TaxID=155865 RepID=UPI003F8B0771
MGRKKQTKKEKIINAAWRLFKVNGYDNTTVEDIISASKTSKGTFYHYFKGKSALLNTLSMVFDNGYEEYYETVTPDMTMSDILLGSNEYLFRLIDDEVDPELMAYLYSSQIVTDDYRCLQDANRFYFRFVRQTLEKGLKSGEFSIQEGTTIEDMLHIYTMYERALLYDWVLYKQGYDLVSYSQRMLRPIVAGFRDGIF